MIRVPITSAKTRIGIFGGSFNPPHVGHLRLAEEVAHAHSLERIIFVPSFMPPHKREKDMAPAEDRLTMTRLACADNVKFIVSEVELSLGATSYTITTLRALAEGCRDDLFFIVGSDSLRDIDQWRDYQELFVMSNFIVVTRPDVSFSAAWQAAPAALRRRFTSKGGEFIHSEGKSLTPSKVIGLSVSSTMIRRLISSRSPIRYLVTRSVESYITEKVLYQDNI